MRSCATVLGLAFMLSCVCASVAGSATLKLYVAPGGNDTWSGRLEAPNTPRTDGPLATLAAARDAVRRMKADGGLAMPVQVLVREGVHHITEPLVFRPEDSGTKACPISYEAYPREHPVISGGRTIGPWRQHRDGTLWVAHVPEALRDGWVFRQLFVNGQRRTLARSPNDGYYHLVGKAAPTLDPVTGEETDTSKTAFRFEPGNIKPWSNLSDVNIVVYYNWETALLRIARVDTETNTVHFTGASKWPFTQQGGGRQRFFVENCPEALDAPGEWFLDRHAGKLYYYPMPGEEPDSIEAVAPVTRQFLVFAGDPDKGRFVDHIRIKGLRFHYCGYVLEPEGHGDWQAAVTVPAAIQANGARHCALEGCEVAHIGTYAVWFRRGCKRNRIAQNHILDLGAGGVRLGQQGRPQDENAETDHNVVTNNFIHDGGKVYAGAVGAWIGHASDNELSHNEICDFNYTGVSCGWSWGYRETGHHRNEIAYNHLHHLGRGVLHDMGAIYTLGISPGTKLHHNLIHDIWSCLPQGGAGGIYPDEGSSEILIENNVVYHTDAGGLTVHYGKDNIVRNNVFAFGGREQVIRGRPEDHRAFTFERNIVYFDRGPVWTAWGDKKPNWEADHNCYWNVARKPLVFLADLSFEQWQKLGLDEHSIVADPKFVAPRRGDFRLRKNSPALKLGIKSIDISGAGLIGPRAWVNLPKRIKRPPVKFAARVEPKPQLVDDGFEHSVLSTTAEHATTHGETSEARIRVTDELAATGKHSLKFTDAPGLDQVWNPHLYYTLGLAEGLAEVQYDLWLGPGAIVWHEWRDAAHPYRVGPSLGIDAKGQLTAGEDALATLPREKWIHFEILCGLGKRATGTYDLTVTVSGEQPRRFEKLSCNPELKRLDWLGFVSNATEKAIFYLDNVRLAVRKKR